VGAYIGGEKQNTLAIPLCRKHQNDEGRSETSHHQVQTLGEGGSTSTKYIILGEARIVEGGGKGNRDLRKISPRKEEEK